MLCHIEIVGVRPGKKRRSTGEITVAVFPETLGPEKERERSSKVLETQ